MRRQYRASDVYMNVVTIDAYMGKDQDITSAQCLGWTNVYGARYPVLSR